MYSSRPLEGLEDGALGDPVPALEIRGLGVERGDRRQLVREVVEDDDEVGLDEARERDADRVAVRLRDGRLERGDGVVREGADRAAGEARHPLDRDDAATRDERSQRAERVRDLRGDDREVGRVVGHADGAGGRVRDPVRDLEQAPRADAQEAVATEALPALDRFQQVGGRRAVVQPEERPDRRLQVRRARRAQEDRVRGGGQVLRLGEAERVGHGGGP
jgi:hypothetical protein